ncbi:DUF3019 domain-containing protein [Catenovulum sp. SX2]|uniref:DUF3019 domain-containing protein n=1 Tax=Catenovulum sp. SX2 TaxID=3398614 RepID=UPI003F876E44
MFFKQWIMRCRLLLLVLFSCPQILNAQQQPHAQSVFMVKPLVCIVEQLGQPCLMQAKFSWQYVSNQANAKLCIWQDQTELFCAQANGQLQHKKWSVELKTSTVFSLRFAQNIIAEQKVEVAGLQPPQYRRRLHSDWSLF